MPKKTESDGVSPQLVFAVIVFTHIHIAHYILCIYKQRGITTGVLWGLLVYIHRAED